MSSIVEKLSATSSRPSGELLACPSHGKMGGRRHDVKRLLFVLSLLLTLPLFALDSTTEASRGDRARRPIIIDDVIRMSQSGVGDDAIIAYIHKYRDRFDV